MAGSQDFWDDLFHGCAFAAFVDQAKAQQRWPDAEATRRVAYRRYEEGECQALTLAPECASMDS